MEADRRRRSRRCQRWRRGNASRLIGPFRVLSVGNRLGSADVLKASGMPQMQENVMTIARQGAGGPARAQSREAAGKLLQSSGFRQAGVMLHPQPTSDQRQATELIE